MADTYVIVTQTPTTDLGPTGSVVPAMQVTFRTKPSDVQARVTLPLSTYTPDEVDRAVRAQAAVIEAVQKL